MKQKKNDLVEKYEQMYFLEGIPEENKEELSQIYEDFSNFLINIGEENLVWGDCHFEIIFIPLIKKLYSEYKETNYVMIYEMFREWFHGGIKPIENMRPDESYLTQFYEYYKSTERVKEIQKRLGKSNNVILVDKHELESLKKITKTTKISDYEVLTDDGFVAIEALHETIEYDVYELKTLGGFTLKCADNHIVMDPDMNERFVKDLTSDDWVVVQDGDDDWLFDRVESVTNLGYKEVMYDLELKEGSNRRYYTNGILSHNTMLAKLLAEYVFGDTESLVRMDMSEYMEKHSVSRLIGSPPGYVGYEQGGQLTEKIRRKPHSVILFDEIEKAHPDVFNLLLQLLDEGQLTDGLGRKVNFKNTLIIMTSNIGVTEVNSYGSSMGFETASSILNEENKARDIIEKALKKKFRPEFLNRLDEAIIFRGLTPENIHKIIYLEIGNLEKRLNEMKLHLTISDEAVEFLGKQGYDEHYGARPLGRAIQHYIEDPVADEIINGELGDGDTVSITFDKEASEIKIKTIKLKLK